MKKKFTPRIQIGIISLSCLIVSSMAAQAQTSTASPPPTPTTIGASLLPSHQVYVTWSASVAANGEPVEYYLYRNGQQIENIPGFTFYTDTPGAGTFSYTVAGYDSDGVSAQSKSTTYVTVPSDTVPPSQPQNLTAAVSSSSIRLSWQVSTDNVGVVGYYISRNGVRILTTSPVTSGSYTDNGLASGATYRYSVQAYDATGNLSDSTSISATTIFDITPPSIPQGITAIATSPSTIALTWQPSSDNISVTGYYVYRNGTLISQVATVSYNDASLSPQGTYQYTIAAYDEAGNVSAKSFPPVIATTPAPDTTTPSIPKDISGAALSTSATLLTWSPSTDNVGVAGYYIYRNGGQIATTASSSYTDTGLTANTTYEYGVSAYDKANNISAKTTVAITTPATHPPTPAPTPVVATPPPTPAPSAATQPTATANITLTTNLYFGTRNTQVTALQSFLIANGYLGSSYATGYFGLLTQTAVQKFQCAKNIVCSGSPGTTGWGSVGPHTRAVING